jgi:glycine/D-amino acid oxidase-like deaminating enzyme/nitrite reductase/ring-hydroxylating ferredoxin subunit
VDVAIVGGGIAGLTCALLLKQMGKRVAVVEADRIVEGVTAYTTAKLTSLHTLIYHELTQNFGAETAVAYGAANQAAIELVKQVVNRYNIDCDFTPAPAYTYTQDPQEVERIQREVEAAQRIGLPAHFVTETPLPFQVAAAVRFDDQAWFHPRKYLLALAEMIAGDGSHIFEQTLAQDVAEGDPCQVLTGRGRVTATDVIIASHFPFYDKAFYFARLSPHFSYLMAMTLHEPAPEGMFIDTSDSRTVRRHVMEGEEMLLVGGEGHKTGQGGDTNARYQRIEEWARRHFAVKTIHHRWATQDYATPDQIPYIGRMTPTSNHLYVATGFKGWGMSSGVAAGLILSDLIGGRRNPWTVTFDPNRIDLDSVGKLARQNLDVASEFAKGYLRPAQDAPLAPGEGRIVNGANGKEAHYRAQDGTTHCLSALCPHMKCVVNWNPAEQSWDCPCHGSRFAGDGRVIHGPALNNLEAKV